MGVLLFSPVFANDALTRGLALKAGSVCHALPPNADTCLQAGSGDLLVVLDALRDTAQPGQSVREAHARLEADWIAPLKIALRRGVIQRLSLIMPGTDITLTRLDLLMPPGIGRLWRRFF